MAALGWFLNLDFAGGGAVPPPKGFCVVAVDVYLPGAVATDVHLPGAVATELFLPGAAEVEVCN